MTGENDREKGFKVEDRRTSRTAEEKKEPAGIGEEGAPDGGETVDRAEADPSGKEESKAHTAPTEGMPPIDFSTFVFSLFHSALIQLGAMEDPASGGEAKNLDAAKQTIDILNVIQEKTEGNLTDEEQKFLESATAELKWKFLNAVKEKG